MVLALSAILCVRMVYRTVRSTVALLFWLIRWGVVLYVVLWAWLWYSTKDEPGSLQHGLATLHNSIQGACGAAQTGLIALGWNLAQHGQQQPGLWASVLQGLQQVTQQDSRSKRRSSRSSRRPKSDPDANLADLVDALGWRDVWESIVDPAPRKKTWRKPATGTRAKRAFS